MMEDVRRITKKYYFKEMVACWLVCWMVFGIPVQIALATPHCADPGTATVDYGQGTYGNTTTVAVTQAETIMGWDNFNTLGGAVDARETVLFSQGITLSNSAVLNRISGGQTQYNGDMSADGMRIFLLNPAGIIFGAGSAVNVTQLVASSMNMSNGAFHDAVNGGDMEFTNPSSYSGARLVGNYGTITATATPENSISSVYFVGKNVLNAGAIATSPGGLVAMVAGDYMLLGQPGSPTIVKTLVVNHVDNHTVDNGAIGGTNSNLYEQFGIDASGNTGTVSTGELVLAAGDIWSNAIENVQDLTAKAYGDIHFEEAINVTGDVAAEAGHRTEYDSDWVYLGPGMGGWPEYEEQGTAEEKGGNLYAQEITAGGNIKLAVGGDNYIYEQEWENTGWYWFFGWYNPGHWVPDTGTYSPGQINLDGDVTATAGFLKLYDNTVVAPYKTLQAGTNLILANTVDPFENCETLTGDTELTLIAGDEIQAENTTISVTGSALTLQQGVTLNTADFLFANQGNTNLTLISDNGSVFSTDNADGGKDENAADQWDSIGATANGGIILSGHENDIKARRLEAAHGPIEVDAKSNDLLANDEGILASGGGNITLHAHDVIVDGDIDAHYGPGIRPAGYNSDLTVDADDDIKLYGYANVDGDLVLDASDDIYAYGNLTSNNGDIELYSSNHTTKLYANVTAYDSVLLNNETELRGSGNQRVEATTGTLTAKRDVEKKTDGDLELAGASGIHLGGDVETHDGHLIFEDAVTANGTCSRRNQKFDADGMGKRLYAWDTITKTTEGDLTLDGGTWSGYEIDLDGDVTVTDGDLTLGHWLSHDDTTVAPDKTLSASDDIKVYGNLNGEGDVTVDAGDDAELYGDVEAAGDLDIYADDDVEVHGNLNGGADVIVDAGDDAKLYGDVEAAGDLDIYASDSTTIYLHGDAYAAGDLSLHANTEFEGWDDQIVDAGGTLTADGYLRKLNTAFFGLFKSDGSLYLHAGGDISLADFVKAADVGYCGCYGGGVSIISETGTIFTPGYGDVLNVPITGRSSFKMCGDYVWGTTGVDLPYGDGKAAIVVISKQQDLTLGAGAELTACGRYDETVFDDRPGVDFLDHDIPADSKLGGDPIDVAIYLASYWDDGRTGGDVTVGSPISCIADNGAMVVDALDSVFFGPDFVSSLIDGKVGWLEACSRISATLETAVGRLPYADNLLAYPGTGKYVLRGENPEVGSGAWVLGSVGTYTHKSYEAASTEEVGFGPGGCPVLMAWLADEIGVEAEDLQVHIANTFALSTDIQPCELCARLKDAATILADADGTGIAALGQVINEFVTTPTPPSEEQMAVIATAFADHTDDGTYYAAAGQWIDALAQYVGIMTELGYPAGDAVALAVKYVAPVMETGDVSLTAYVEARLAVLGG